MAYTTVATSLLTSILSTAEDGEDQSRYGDGFEVIFEKARAWRDRRGGWKGTDKEAQVILQQVARAVYSDSEDFSYGDNFDELFAEVTSFYPSDRQRNPHRHIYGPRAGTCPDAECQERDAPRLRLKALIKRVEVACSNGAVVVHAGHPLSRAYAKAIQALDFDEGTRDDPGIASAYQRLLDAATKAGIGPGQMNTQIRHGNPVEAIPVRCDYCGGAGSLSQAGWDKEIAEHGPGEYYCSEACRVASNADLAQRSRVRTLAARWESRGKKNWLDLFKNPDGTFSYQSTNGGGYMGTITFGKAMDEAKRHVDALGVQMTRVFPLPAQRTANPTDDTLYPGSPSRPGRPCVFCGGFVDRGTKCEICSKVDDELLDKVQKALPEEGRIPVLELARRAGVSYDETMNALDFLHRTRLADVRWPRGPRGLLMGPNLMRHKEWVVGRMRRGNPGAASEWDRVQRMTREQARRYLGGDRG